MPRLSSVLIGLRRSTCRAFPLIVSLSIAAIALPAVPIAWAQTSTPAPAAHPAHHPAYRHFEPGRYIEGRIAFLKAVLKITPAQEAAWDKVAAAMRENVQEMRQMFERLHATRGHPRTAVERLELRAQFARLKATQSQRFVDAFRPLYASFSPDQKATADHLFGPHRWRHGRGHRW
jgi:periplasmic protein CpxP/Spy